MPLISNLRVKLVRFAALFQRFDNTSAYALQVAATLMDVRD